MCSVFCKEHVPGTQPEPCYLVTDSEFRVVSCSPVAAAPAKHQAEAGAALGQPLRRALGPGTRHQGCVPTRGQPIAPDAEPRPGGERGPVSWRSLQSPDTETAAALTHLSSVTGRKRQKHTFGSKKQKDTKILLFFLVNQT